MSHSVQASFVNPNNPYAQFRCCCTTLNIKEHAQFCGVLSFTLFLCLVVISMMLFGALSLFFIVIGVVVYSLLMKTLFSVVSKMSICFYLLFEAIQIGFYLALMFFIIFPLLFLEMPRHRNCYNSADGIDGTRRFSEICDEPKSNSEESVELLLFVALLASIKLHFARVFAHFYKYVTWNEQFSVQRAQYINGRGIHITVDSRPFGAASPNFCWDNRMAKDGGGQKNANQCHQIPQLPPPYAQVMGGQQRGGTIGGRTNGARDDQ